jgi:hypothetical protein
MTNLMSMVDSTRAHALGGAAAALEGDPTLVWHNPASASRLNAASVTLGGQRGFIDDMAWQVSGLHPAGPGRVVSAGFAYYSSGSVLLRSSDGTERRVNGQQDLMAMAGAGMALCGWASAGFSAKVMRTELVDEFRSVVAAVDLGLNIRCADTLTAGLALQNAGNGVRYSTERIPLPAAALAGVAIQSEAGAVELPAFDSFSALLDAAYRFADRGLEWRAGVELRAKEVLAVRIGAGLPPERTRLILSMGLGVELRHCRVDYATRFGEGEAGATQSVSLTFSL